MWWSSTIGRGKTDVGGGGGGDDDDDDGGGGGDDCDEGKGWRGGGGRERRRHSKRRRTIGMTIERTKEKKTAMSMLIMMMVRKKKKTMMTERSMWQSLIESGFERERVSLLESWAAQCCCQWQSEVLIGTCEGAFCVVRWNLGLLTVKKWLVRRMRRMRRERGYSVDHQHSRYCE